MATHIHHHGVEAPGHEDSSIASLIVMLLVVLLLVGFALFAFGALPFVNTNPGTTNRFDVDVPEINVPAPAPDAGTPTTPAQ